MVYIGNSNFPGDSYQYPIQFIKDPHGRKIFRAVGIGILTETLQTAIPIYIYPARNALLSPQYPNIGIVIPSGAQVVSASFRLPSLRIVGSQKQWGAQVDTGTTIIGTSTDVLKLSFGSNNTFSAANTASLASASSLYTLGGSNRITRGIGAADNASGILNTLGSQSTLNLVVDNAANGAAGTGIALSTSTGQKAVIVADIIWTTKDDPVSFAEVPNLTQTFTIRS
jgi:hypothetical protein